MCIVYVLYIAGYGYNWEKVNYASKNSLINGFSTCVGTSTLKPKMYLTCGLVKWCSVVQFTTNYLVYSFISLNYLSVPT